MAEIYIYRSVGSNGARDLARALGAQRVKVAPRAGVGDFVVCWGESWGAGRLPGARILNGGPIKNKYEDALTLQQAQIPTIEVSLRRGVAPEVRLPRVEAPAPANANIRNLFNHSMEMANDFVENDAPNFGSPVFKRGINDFRDSLVNLANALANDMRVPPQPQVQNVAAPIEPAREGGEWLGRRFYHVGGKDLLGLNRNPVQYFVRKEDIVEEYRIHSFLGKSIRAGRKVKRDEVARPHEWVRSWDGGWKISYEGFKSTAPMRDLAARAVASLGLDFGAVDLAKTRDGRLIVLEVNRAPGIENNTITAYKEAIERWIKGEN